MARPRLPQQQQLIQDVLHISLIRENVERLLTHVIAVQANAVALAGAYGAKQTDLGVVMGVSRQRISQLFDEVDTTGLTQRALEAQIHQVQEWPADVMSALWTLAHDGADDDVATRERERRRVAVAYGEEEAQRRYDARSAFLSSLPTDAEAAGHVSERMERARRIVAGTPIQTPGRR